MGQTISSSFVWKRGSAPATGSDGDEPCEEVPDANDLVPLPIELSDTATRPKRATGDAAGFDLCAAQPTVVPPDGKWVCVSTGIKMAIGAPSVKRRLGADTVVYGAIRARSGLTFKGLDVFHGTIDADYRGEILVMVRNRTSSEFEIERGDRIAQLIFSIALVPNMIDYEDIETAFETTRGSGGFGSTGVSPRVEATIEVAEAAPEASDAHV